MRKLKLNVSNIRKSFQLVLVGLCAGLLLSACSSLYYGQAVNLNCADSIEAEFRKNYEIHSYHISLNPGDQLTARVEPVGDYLLTALELFEPAQDRIIFQTDNQTHASFTTGILSGRGNYTLKVRNYSVYPDDRINLKEKGRAGVYSLTLSCLVAEP